MLFLRVFPESLGTLSQSTLFLTEKVLSGYSPSSKDHLSFLNTDHREAENYPSLFQVIQADFGQGQTLLNSLNNLRTHKVVVSMASRNYHCCCLCTHDRQEPGLSGN